MSWSYCCCEPDGNLWVVGGSTITKWNTKHAEPYSDFPSDKTTQYDWKIGQSFPINTWAANGHTSPLGHSCDQSFFYLLTTVVSDEGQPYDFRIAVYDKESGSFVRFIDLERGPNWEEHVFAYERHNFLFFPPGINSGGGSALLSGIGRGALLMSSNRISISHGTMYGADGSAQANPYLPLWDHSGQLVAEIDVGRFKSFHAGLYPIFNEAFNMVVTEPYMDSSGNIYIVGHGRVNKDKQMTGEVFYSTNRGLFGGVADIFVDPTDSYKYDGKISEVVTKYSASGSKEWEADIETTTDGVCRVFDSATAPDGSTYVWVEQHQAHYSVHAGSAEGYIATPPHVMTSPQHIAEIHKISSSGSAEWSVKFCYTRDTYNVDMNGNFEDSDGTQEKPFWYAFHGDVETKYPGPPLLPDHYYQGDKVHGGRDYSAKWKIGVGLGTGQGKFPPHAAYNNGPSKAPSPDIDRIERHSYRAVTYNTPTASMWTSPDSSLWISHVNRFYNYPSGNDFSAHRYSTMWHHPLLSGYPEGGDVAGGGFHVWYAHFDSGGSIDWNVPFAPEEEQFKTAGFGSHNGFDNSGEFWYHIGGGWWVVGNSYIFKRQQGDGPPTMVLNISDPLNHNQHYSGNTLWGDVPAF